MKRDFFEEIEGASREVLTRFQEDKLRAQVQHAYANSPFYRLKFDEAKVKPEDIQTLQDLRKLPFTTKEELRQDQAIKTPWGSFLSKPIEDCLRVHFTSGTTGKPLLVCDTAEDWYGFYHSYARALYAFGVRKSDMVMAAFSYGPWIGFWSGFYAAQDIGALILPSGGMSTDQRIDALLTYPITVLGCTPSYALYLAEESKKKGIDLAKESKLRIIWHTGEPGASIPSTKKKIEEAFGAKCFDLPGLTEIAAWGYECEAQSGQVHVHEDYVYPEVLDVETGEPVGPGERGELVFTSLYRTAMPLLRYRTRDIVVKATVPCPCGRTLLGLDHGVIGRLDDMKKIRGVIVYPSNIEQIIRKYKEVVEFFIHIRRVDGLDEIIVDIEPEVGYPSDLIEKIKEDMKIGLGIRVSIEVVKEGSLPRWDHKAKRFKDEREEVPF
ncbi:MAG: phenylacetate--CoA ligase [Desulfitobacterium hafniense]|nr:phenylacetate--CoA ligase [Desulfitobacterium hafniense]